jgi:hypothetical protein
MADARPFTDAPRLTIYVQPGDSAPFPKGSSMRAEAEALTQSIQQSMGLLRRHL